MIVKFDTSTRDIKLLNQIYGILEDNGYYELLEDVEILLNCLSEAIKEQIKEKENKTGHKDKE